MKAKSMKTKTFFIILLGMLSCTKNNESLNGDHSDSGSFTGILGTKQVSWSKPDYSSQQSTAYWSKDSIGYSFQIFNEYDRISLIVRPIKESDFNNTFRLGKYRIGIDYNIVLSKEGNFYYSSQISNDSIELIKIDKINNEILCYYRFDCNLYDKEGNYYDRIKNGNLLSIFKVIDK